MDEIYDDDNDGSVQDDYAAGNWRMMEEKFYQQGVISNLVYKRVTTYVDDISDTVDDTILYYYGYDQVGNVVYISEDTGASTTKRFVFHQDAFGNEVDAGVFSSSSWATARGRD